MKNSSTVLLGLEENIPDNQVEQINKALRTHKNFGTGGYKLVNWVVYNSVYSKGTSGNSDDDDIDDFDFGMEVADNQFSTPRNAIRNRLNRSQT